MAVVGAGACGGWTALFLARAGVQVTLVDAWGPGNPRSSSGGDTRVWRQAYGAQAHYVELAGRARELWERFGAEWGVPLFQRTGLVWLVGDDDAYERASLETLAARGVAVERWTPDELGERHPEFDRDGVRWVLVERDAGVLFARRACEAVWEAAGSAGARCLTARAGLLPWRDGRCPGLRLGPAPAGAEGAAGAAAETHAAPDVGDADGEALEVDAMVLAAGPWLPEWLAGLEGGAVPAPRFRVTRQEVFTFGVPAGLTHAALPVWADHGERFVYGIPDNPLPDGRRGFKLADDTRGPPFDPTHGPRTPEPEALARAQAYLARRFPALAGAPLLDARVCQYTDTPDRELVADRHPAAADLWVVGGGSGHGFKHGPALGEHLARRILGEDDGPARFPLHPGRGHSNPASRGSTSPK